MRGLVKMRSVAGIGLVSLLWAMATGLPSHHHSHHHSEGDDVRVETPDHGHFTQLVDQPDRVAPQLPALITPGTVPSLDEQPAARRPMPRSNVAYRPNGRSPPPAAPRAPPALT